MFFNVRRQYMRATRVSRWSWATAGTLSVLCPAFASAQDATPGFLISSFKAKLPGQGKWLAGSDLRSFRGDESKTYIGLQGLTAFTPEWGLRLAAGFAPKESLSRPGFVLRSGGSDVEAQVVYAPATVPNLIVMGGAAGPSTPNQSEMFLTAQVLYSSPFVNGDATLGAKGAFRKDSDLAAVFAGAEYRLAQGFSVVAEYNAVLTGNNTYDLAGGRKRTNTYGLALRYRPSSSDATFSLGITNSLGATTGFSMTPGLNDSPALYLGVSINR